MDMLTLPAPSSGTYSVPVVQRGSSGSDQGGHLPTHQSRQGTATGRGGALTTGSTATCRRVFAMLRLRRFPGPAACHSRSESPRVGTGSALVGWLCGPRWLRRAAGPDSCRSGSPPPRPLPSRPGGTASRPGMGIREGSVPRPRAGGEPAWPRRRDRCRTPGDRRNPPCRTRKWSSVVDGRPS